MEIVTRKFAVRNNVVRFQDKHPPMIKATISELAFPADPKWYLRGSSGALPASAN